MQSEASTNAHRLDDRQSLQKSMSIEKSLDLQLHDKEWLCKSRFLDKDTYFKVFSKYSQVDQFTLTNIYDPPLTLKEIRKLRRDKRKQYNLKGAKPKNAKPVSDPYLLYRKNSKSLKAKLPARALMPAKILIQKISTKSKNSKNAPIVAMKTRKMKMRKTKKMKKKTLKTKSF